MICTQRRLRISAVLIGLLLTFIWGNSLMSGEVSLAFSQWAKHVLAWLLPWDLPVVEEGSGLLRKLAHFAEFAALGMCLAWRNGMRKKAPHWAFLCGAAAAALDETIQCFVPGRGPAVKDALLDSGGVLTGMFFIYLGHTILKKRKTNSHNFGGYF